MIDWLTNQSNDWSTNQPSDCLLENTWEVFFQYKLVGKYAAERMEGFVAQHAVSLTLSEKIIEKHATVIGNKQKIQMVNFWAWHQYFTSNQLRHYLILQQSCLTLHLATFFLGLFKKIEHLLLHNIVCIKWPTKSKILSPCLIFFTPAWYIHMMVTAQFITTFNKFLVSFDRSTADEDNVLRYM